MSNAQNPVASEDFWISAVNDSGASIFSFSEYLAALALLLIVVTISDFRYRLRLALLGKHVRPVAFGISILVGLLILLTDFWFENRLPIPYFMNNPNNIKATFGLVFLIFVFYLNYVAFLRPRKLSERSADRFVSIGIRIVASGDESKILTFLEEIEDSLDAVFQLASKITKDKDGQPVATDGQGAANDLILLLADPRVCKVIAKSFPPFAQFVLFAYRDHGFKKTPISLFHRNVASAFFEDESSSVFLEHEGYDTGFFGFAKPTTNVLFGDYNIVQASTDDGASPFDLDYRLLRQFNEKQANAVSRAALVFFEDYLDQTSGNSNSTALAQLRSLFTYLLSDTARLNDPQVAAWPSDVLGKIESVVHFAEKAIELLDSKEIKPSRHQRRGGSLHPYRFVSEIVFLLIEKGAWVNTEEFVSWEVQHNTIWSQLIDPTVEYAAHSEIRKQVFRLMYNQIKRMNEHPNFRGARILGTVLYVVSINELDRNDKRVRGQYPIQKVALDWVRQNFISLHDEYPVVAETIMMGSLSYDPAAKRITKTMQGWLGKPGRQHHLNLD